MPDRETVHGRLPTPSPSIPPMVAIVGYSGSGKTTLLVKLIEEFCRRGLQVGTLKHDVHGFELDRPGKDTWRHKKAGATVTIISSPQRIGMVREVDHDHRPAELLPFFQGLDLVLVEGFKRVAQPKIEVFRTATRKDPACREDPDLVAVVSDGALDWGVPCFDLDNVSALADFIGMHFLGTPAPGVSEESAPPPIPGAD